jgi:hypothetical protein
MSQPNTNTNTNTNTMTVSSPNVERKASINPSDYADLRNKNLLPCKVIHQRHRHNQDRHNGVGSVGSPGGRARRGRPCAAPWNRRSRRASGGSRPAPFTQADQQVGDQGRVLDGALHQRQRVLDPVDADTEGDDTAGFGKVHAVDHQRHQVQPGQIPRQAARPARFPSSPRGGGRPPTYWSP